MCNSCPLIKRMAPLPLDAGSEMVGEEESGVAAAVPGAWACVRRLLPTQTARSQFPLHAFVARNSKSAHQLIQNTQAGMLKCGSGGRAACRWFNEGPSSDEGACPAYAACSKQARGRDATRFVTWADGTGPNLYPRRAGQIRNHSRAARPCSIEHRVGIQSAQMAISTLWIRILILFFRECGASSTGPKLSLAPPLVLRLLHLLLLLLVLLLFLLSSFLWSSCPSLLVPLHAPVLVLPLCHRLRHSVGKFSTSTLTVVPLFRHGHAGEMLRARDADLLQRL